MREERLKLDQQIIEMESEIQHVKQLYQETLVHLKVGEEKIIKLGDQIMNDNTSKGRRTRDIMKEFDTMKSNLQLYPTCITIHQCRH